MFFLIRYIFAVSCSQSTDTYYIAEAGINDNFSSGYICSIKNEKGCHGLHLKVCFHMMHIRHNFPPTLDAHLNPEKMMPIKIEW